MKKIKLILVLLFVTIFGFSQLKVDRFGRIGMGTNYPNSGYKCHIQGNLLLTSYPSTPFYELQFKVSRTGTEIGSSKDYIDFWASYVGHNKLAVERVYTVSDSNLKANIVPLNDGVDKLMRISCFKYDLLPKYDSLDNLVSNKQANYGFLSQEIEREFNEVNITYNSHGVKLMDYNQIIPVVVKATQEQQVSIDSLRDALSELKKEILKIKSKLKDTDFNENIINDELKENSLFIGNKLYQNHPNPFSESTSINYEVTKNDFQSGSILIFDMNGALLKTYPVSPGNNEVKINGNVLKSGMYIYSLIVNEKEIDTKRMILSK